MVQEIGFFIYKIQSTGLPKYLLQLIPTNHSYILRKTLNIQHFYCRTDTFKNLFFSNVINEWNKLGEKIKDVTSFSLFKASLLKKVCPHFELQTLYVEFVIQLE